MTKLPKLQRQLLLYVLFYFRTDGYFLQHEEILQFFPGISRKMLQRDMNDLRDAELICVKYNHKEQGYQANGAPVFHADTRRGRNAHLLKLQRLGTLMFELDMDGIDAWMIFGEGEYTSATTSYKKLYPDISDRQRSRDFSILNSLGFLYFSPEYRTHIPTIPSELPETFNIHLGPDGKMYYTPGQFPWN